MIPQDPSPDGPDGYILPDFLLSLSTPENRVSIARVFSHVHTLTSTLPRLPSCYLSIVMSTAPIPFVPRNLRATKMVSVYTFEMTRWNHTVGDPLRLSCHTV